MKRYIVTSRNRISFDSLDNAVDCAKRFARNNDCAIYVSELVGAVHPGKPRWRPTERNKELKPQLYTYKIRIRNYPIDMPVPLVKEIRALTGYGLKEAKDIMDGYGYFVVKATNNEFSSIESRLENAGATIDHEIS